MLPRDRTGSPTFPRPPCRPAGRLGAGPPPQRVTARGLGTRGEAPTTPHAGVHAPAPGCRRPAAGSHGQLYFVMLAVGT